MKIAWIGPMVKAGGGASGVALQLLQELGSRGVEVDCYMAGELSAVPQQLLEYHSLSFHCLSVPWQWNRWYSRNNFLAFVTGQAANFLTENRLARLLYKNHLSEQYDLIYQFSHIEVSSLRRYHKRLPPIVLHPSVHAAGELRWHINEAYISRQTERGIIRFGVRTLLKARSMVQRRHIRIPRQVLALSQNFAEDLVADYGIASSQIDIVPNPVDLEEFYPTVESAGGARKEGRSVILFVSRIAVRKGVEQIVELSHRLDDIADKVEIRIVGYKSLWSDYTALLKSINPRTAKYIYSVPFDEMADLYRGADMLVQPSKYEPFGLTVGESLACGVPVVASDKVGAAELVHPLCRRTFPCNDMDAFEQEVRKLLQDLSDEPLKNRISELSRAEAERLYSASVIGDKLVNSFQRLLPHETRTQEVLTGLTLGRNI